MKRIFIAGILASLSVATIALLARADTTVTDPGLIGTNEKLLLVVAGDFPTRADAEQANTRYSFGDVQGFYLAPSSSFEGIAAGRWLLLSAFRTEPGAQEFEELATAAGATDLQRIVARYLGTEFIGLGQEPNPDGTGPLLGPLPDDSPHRIE
jgi:hypothetical protein